MKTLHWAAGRRVLAQWALGVVGMAGVAGSMSALAQSSGAVPTTPLKLIVGYAAGGPVD